MGKEEFFTGERVILNHTTPERIIRDHLERYHFARKYITGKKVLDLACGTGYGSLEIAEGGAKYVLGGDISLEAINFAKKNYSHKNLKFQILNCEKINLPDNSFDVIISFETIEHIPNYKKFLCEIQRVLKKEGLFICSSPNKMVTSPFTKKPLNKYHIKEFSLKELKEDLTNLKFRVVEIYGQSFFKPDKTFYIKKFLVSFFPYISKIKKKFIHKTKERFQSSQIRSMNENSLEEPTFFLIISKNEK